MVSMDRKGSAKQGYLYIKSQKKPLMFNKGWYKAYFVLQHDPFVLGEYKNSSLKILCQLHQMESISHVAKFVHSKSQQFAFKVVLDDCEELVFGCDNPILLTEWMAAFKQIIDILKCGFSMNTNNFHTEYGQFQVLVLETKLSKANCLKGNYILLINQSQVSLYSKNEFTEVLSWPISCMSFQSSQPTSKRLIFVMGKTCHFGIGVLKFETSACDEILDCIKAHSDASNDKYPLNVSESLKSEHFFSRNPQSFDSDDSLPRIDLGNEDFLTNTSEKYTNNNVFSSCDKYQSYSPPKTLAIKSLDNTGYITPNTFEPNRMVFHEKKGHSCEQHSAFSTSTRFKNNNDDFYVEVVEKENEKLSVEEMLISVTSGLVDPIKHQISLSAAKGNLIINSSPKDSPKLPPKLNPRRSSEPMNFQVNGDLKSNVFDKVLGNSSPKSGEKRFNDSLTEFQNRLKNSALKRKSVLMKLPGQVLHQEEERKTEKPPELNRNMKPGWGGAPLVKNGVQVTEQVDAVDVPPPVPERIATPKLICKRLNNKHLSLEENCNESNKPLSANQICSSPPLPPKLSNVSQILTDDPSICVVNSFAVKKEKNPKDNEILSLYPPQDAKCITERENLPILKDCINLQTNIQNGMNIDSHLQKLMAANKFLPKILFEKTPSSLFPKPKKSLSKLM